MGVRDGLLHHMMFVNVHLQLAVDAARVAASQSVDVPYFISAGELRIDHTIAPEACETQGSP